MPTNYGHQPPPTQATHTQTFPPRLRPAAPKTNPFIGWPISDYIRDAAAALALLCAFGMPWRISTEPKAGDQWWVVLALLLSLSSLVVPYLAKANVVPGWSVAHYRLTKLGLNAPLLLCVLAAVLFELVHVTDDFEGGLGSGIAMALTGVALAVQPRTAEDSHGGLSESRWNRVAQTVATIAVVLTVLLFVGWLLHGAAGDGVDPFDPIVVFLALVVAFLLIPLALFAYPAYMWAIGTRSVAWARVLATVGFTVVAVALFALASDREGLFFWADAEKWYGADVIPGGGGLLVGATAALASSRPALRATRATDPVSSWVATVSAALQISAAGSALIAAAILLLMLDSDIEAGPIVTIVLLLVATGAAGFGITLLSDIRKNRVTLLGVLAGIFVLGCVALGINNSAEFDSYVLLNNGYAVAAWITLPALAAYALIVPKDIRGALGPLVTGGAHHGNPAGQPQQYPPQPYSHPTDPGHYGAHQPMQQPIAPPQAPPPAGPGSPQAG